MKRTTAGKGVDFWLRIVVLSMGAALVALLFFADKRNLTNKPRMAPATSEVATQAPVSLPGTIAPLPDDPRLQAWVDQLAEQKDAAKLPLLDSIVVSLQAGSHFVQAADFASQRAAIDRSFSNLLTAGHLYLEASRQPGIMADSSVFRSYSERSLSFLTDALKLNPRDENALLLQGLALVESQQPQNSMRGIMAIREVLTINPDNLKASFHLGQFSLQTGQYEKAIARFEKVLSLDPEWDQARLKLAIALYQNGKLEASRLNLEKIVERQADSESVQVAQSLLKQLPTKK